MISECHEKEDKDEDRDVESDGVGGRNLGGGRGHIEDSGRVLDCTVGGHKSELDDL
jgi:hypothetical protein